MTKTPKKLLFFSLAAGILVFILAISDPVNQYISVMKSEASKVSADRDTSLRDQILEWKKKKDEAPINAYVDRIWKAIPGYNGRVVDVEASLEQMNKQKLNTEEGLVFKEVPPEVSLDQLGAYPVYRGNPQKKAVSFMINVAWGNEYLDKMLSVLEKHKIKTTFFLDGSWVKKYPELARKIKEQGHEIANHAYSHPDMAKLGADRIRQEIGKTQEIIERTLGVKPTLFAPPSGSFNNQVVRIAHDEFRMKTILWTADTVDWQNPPVQAMVQRVEKKLGNGVLLLMHPTSSSANGLEQLLNIADKRGLQVTTVSEVLSSNRLKR